MTVAKSSGFTLIEMSIVLVIVGLIVGSVLVGQDLIRAAYVRAQISQVETFNTAANTFYGKYEALPGDISASTATTFGFQPRGQYAGEGDGNGIVEGAELDDPCCTPSGQAEATGETVMFWSDLTYANGLNLNLIEGSFTAASTHVIPTLDIPQTGVGRYLPEAKVGGGNFVYAYSNQGTNYYGLSVPAGIANWGIMSGGPGLTVEQAYRIDAKVDDGMPQSGNVTAAYASWCGNTVVTWAFGGDGYGGHCYKNETAVPDTSPEPDGAYGGASYATTCYNNGSVAGLIPHYSVEVNRGAGLNCALSFKFQ